MTKTPQTCRTHDVWMFAAQTEKNERSILTNKKADGIINKLHMSEAKKAKK